ncbi:MAG: aminodeoxychorismate synthase component I [Phycisphaerae bacterium]|nr:aminodeoxychorismate synthase component I [Phycisphaerae bacterium]
MARIVVETLATDASPAALLRRLAGEPEPAALDSSAPDLRDERYSVLAAAPIRTLTCREGVLTDGDGARLAEGADAFAALERAFASVRAVRPAGAGPYLPGWIGYVGYEMARCIERLPGRARRDTALPDLRLALYDAVAVHDARTGSWRLIRLVFDTPPRGAGRGERILRRLAATTPDEATGSPDVDAIAAVRPAAHAESPFTAGGYRRAVAQCVAHIAAGDVFQVNLSQRLTVAAPVAPIDLYLALRRRNPAAYAAYLAFESDERSCAVLSSSPELFLRLRGRRVVTRPIKGTRRRGGDLGADARAAAELRASEKDNAELAMIVDLLRNDLGRICEYGSIRVVEPNRLEAHPTVFHLVATVAGRLRGDVGPAALLRATFPGGSITGAPKIRAMEIIDDLEPTARGPYTGCIGYVGVDGTCTWNIAIRTIVWQEGLAHVQVGGGIVADSNPAAEHQETLDKARAMLEALHQVVRGQEVPR